jgi:hypothetical protein
MAVKFTGYSYCDWRAKLHPDEMEYIIKHFPEESVKGAIEKLLNLAGIDGNIEICVYSLGRIRYYKAMGANNVCSRGAWLTIDALNTTGVVSYKAPHLWVGWQTQEKPGIAVIKDFTTAIRQSNKERRLLVDGEFSEPAVLLEHLHDGSVSHAGFRRLSQNNLLLQ